MTQLNEQVPSTFRRVSADGEQVGGSWGDWRAPGSPGVSSPPVDASVSLAIDDPETCSWHGEEEPCGACMHDERDEYERITS